MGVRRLLLAVMLTVLAWPVAAETATKPENIALLATGPESVAKGYYDLQAQPGDVKVLPFVVSNPTDQPIVGEVYATDAATADNGGISARGPQEKNVSAGAWLTGPPSLTQPLAAGEERSVSFTLKVPAQAAPGQHVASVIARVYTEGTDPGKPTGEKANFKINVLHQVIIGVLVTIPGPTNHSLRATGAELFMQGDQPWLRVLLQNDGNVIEKPKVTVRLLDTNKKELSSQERPMDSVYPGTSGGALVQAIGLTKAGQYYVDATVEYGNNQRATGTFQVGLTAQQSEEARAVQAEKAKAQQPAGVIMLSTRTLAIAAGVLVVVALLGIGLWIWRRRR